MPRHPDIATPASHHGRARVAQHTVSAAPTLYARHDPGFDARLTQASACLDAAAAEFGGAIVLASSFGAEDMVLTDLVARRRLPIAVATLDTGALHAETLALVARVERHYGLQVERYRPQPVSVLQFVRRHGERTMYESVELRKACCAVRKLEPLARLLAPRRAWVTGLRREQSAQRGTVPLREADEQGRAKFSPLAAWTWHDVWHYIATHEVPYNPLHDAFMPSIGCAPCTRAIAVGEDFRAGRWWWEQDPAKECGLHLRPHTPSPTGAPA